MTFIQLKQQDSFFRKLDNGDLGAMSVLHERMDLPVLLREIWRA